MMHLRFCIDRKKEVGNKDCGRRVCQRKVVKDRLLKKYFGKIIVKESSWKKNCERTIMKGILKNRLRLDDWKRKIAGLQRVIFHYFLPFFLRLKKTSYWPTNGSMDGLTARHTLLWHINYLTIQSLCQSTVKEVFSNPCHFCISSPILSKMAPKDSVLKIVFTDGVTSQDCMKNKQYMAVMILQVFNFVTKCCLSKIQNLQRILKNKKIKNVRFL